MDKQMYKQLVAEYMRREAKLKQQVLELTMENAELKDMVLDNGGDYTQFPETDGLEVGSPSDYKEDPQLNLFDERPMIYESPDGGKTIYGRRAGDSVREQFNRECD
jgi:hypothetical protein